MQFAPSVPVDPVSPTAVLRDDILPPPMILVKEGNGPLEKAIFDFPLTRIQSAPRIFGPFDPGKVVRKIIMARRCEVTGKGTKAGKSIARRGLPKKKGGVGLKTTGHTKRKFKSNIQKLRVLLPNGTVRRMRLATSVIKKGEIEIMLEGRMQTVPLVKALRGRNREFSKINS